VALAATSSAALLLAGTTALAAGPAGAAARSSSGSTGASTKIVYQVHPIAIKSSVGAPSSTRPSQATLESQWPFTPGQCVALFGVACYTPQILHTAYQIPWKINGDWAGKGQSVAIIDAYGSPTVASDLATFDAEFGLPAANLHVWYPLGKPTYNPRQHLGETGWAEETSLDVQTVHDLAPGATINLVVAPTPAGNALNLAEQFAVQHHLGSAMTMSFGIPEAAFRGNNSQMMQANAIYAQAANEGISVFASSGDSGATNGAATPNANFPASDPNVTAAGGTDLFVGADAPLVDTKGGTVVPPPGATLQEIEQLLAEPQYAKYASMDYTYANETAWADFNSSTCPFGCTSGAFGATGGAPSAIFPAPSWQTGLTSWDTAAMAAADTNMMRTTSDVAFNASVYTSTLIYLGFLGGNNNGFYFFGGTSEASPSWAAITADLDQARATESTPQGPLGLMSPKLYKLASKPMTYAADFHDVTVGENNDPASATGFSAGTGYDLPTGLGTPIVTGLLNSLAPGVRYSLSGN
jgi:subtilase family serine protease